MRVLIRHGFLHTQSSRGVFRGDVLMEDGCITAVEQELPIPPDTDHVIDASDLHVCPGLIDAHVHLLRSSAAPEKDIAAVAREALNAGVTGCALWRDDGEECLLRLGEQQASVPGMVRLTLDGKDDRTLLHILRNAARDGVRLACEVYGEAQARRILALIRGTGASVVLVHLNSCCDLADELISSGCPVVLGACCLRGQGNAFELAALLQRRGATVAITCDYPATRLHYLPISAGLCVRAGLEPEEALRMVTLDAARLLGLADSTGSIEVGKRADLALFEGHPLRLSAIHRLTILGGQLIES